MPCGASICPAPSRAPSTRAPATFALACRLPAQREADEEAARLKPAERKKAAARQKTHQRLRIISGTAAGERWWAVEP